MKVADLIQALQELKQKNPIYDFHQFSITIDGFDVSKLEVIEGFKINLISQSEPEPETKEGE